MKYVFIFKVKDFDHYKSFNSMSQDCIISKQKITKSFVLIVFSSMGSKKQKVDENKTFSDCCQQSQKKLIGQIKKIKQKQVISKNFDICVSVIFSCYDQSVISRRKTGHLALPPTYFEIFLIFPGLRKF